MACRNCPSLPAHRRGHTDARSVAAACDNSSPELAARPVTDKALFAEHPGRFYAALWADYVALHDSLAAQAEALLHREAQATGLPPNDYRAAMGDLVDTPDFAVPRKRALRIVGALADIAVVRFTPPGHPPVAIDETPYRQRLIDDACYARDPFGHSEVFIPHRFDPASVWDALAADWDIEKATTAIYRAAARAIEGGFHFDPGQPLDRQRNGVLLRHSVSVGDRWEPTSNRLHYDCCRRMVDRLKALSTFALWAGDDALAESARRWLAHFDSRCEITSRQRIGITGRLSITTYKQRFDWWIEDGLAEQLQIFLGLYGERMRAPSIEEAAA
jgi:hypothetical protein